MNRQIEKHKKKTENFYSQKCISCKKIQTFGIEVPALLGYSQQRAEKEPMNASEWKKDLFFEKKSISEF